jgi:hypothetical protein
MPILYVHGVNVRSREGFFTIEPLLRRHVAPIIADDPSRVRIEDYYWGNLGVRLAWNGASRPRTQLRGKGIEQSSDDVLVRTLAADENRALLAQYPPPAIAPAEDEGPLSASGLRSGGAPARHMPPLTDLTSEQISDVLVSLTAPPAALQDDYSSPPTEAKAKESGIERARLILAADKIAHDPATLALLAGKSPEQQVALLVDRLRAEAAASDELAGKGFGDLWAGLKERLGEALERGDDRLGYVLSILAAELRPKLNAMVSMFIGDVFVYLHGRDDPKTRPGEILAGLIKKLKEEDEQRVANGERLIVLTHSMGGQLVWDAVSFQLAADPTTKDIRIDFWCAAASQVGFFEEAKLFLASDPNHRPGFPVPFPQANLGVWWNAWDYNDVLSFTAEGICAGVDDDPYSSGKSLLEAHGGYLERPSFYRELARKVTEAKKKEFKTT